MKKLLAATGITALVAAIVEFFVHHKKELTWKRRGLIRDMPRLSL